MSQLNSVRHEEFPLLWRGLAILFTVGFLLIEWGPSTLGRAICFIVYYFKWLSHPKPKPNNNVWWSIWARCGPVNKYIKLTIIVRNCILPTNDWSVAVLLRESEIKFTLRFRNWLTEQSIFCLLIWSEKCSKDQVSESCSRKRINGFEFISLQCKKKCMSFRKYLDTFPNFFILNLTASLWRLSLSHSLSLYHLWAIENLS